MDLTTRELLELGERELGVSGWWTVEQRHIDLFADATDDHQWIHVDPESAATGPFGRTIAHGYLTLALLTSLIGEVISVTDTTMAINYGIDRVRFISPVAAGSRIRAKVKLLNAEQKAGGVLCKFGVEVEIEHGEKPALVGEVLHLSLPVEPFI